MVKLGIGITAINKILYDHIKASFVGYPIIDPIPKSNNVRNDAKKTLQKSKKYKEVYDFETGDQFWIYKLERETKRRSANKWLSLSSQYQALLLILK